MADLPSFFNGSTLPATQGKVLPTMDLCPVGLEKWSELPERVFSYAPPDLLTAYCQAYATYRHYEEMFARDPSLRIAQKFNFEGACIGEAVSPEAKIAADALKQMMALAKQLSL